LISEAKKSASPTLAQKSGLIPNRSRERKTERRGRSRIDSAHMPTKRSTQSGPHCAYAASTTSVSPVETKE
jgi:hypothetical protein